MISGIVCVAVTERSHRVVGEQITVDDRCERQSSRCLLRNPCEQFVRRPEKVLGGSGSQQPQIGLAAAEDLEKQLRDDLAAFTPVHRSGGRTFGDGAMKQSAGGRDGHQRRHGAAACRLTEQRHSIRVTTEGCDVALNPLQRCNHVAESDIGLEGMFTRIEGREVDEAENTDTVVDRDDDNVTVLGQCGCVEKWLAGCSAEVRSAVNPDHHRFTRRIRTDRARRPHVEEQAVLVHRNVLTERNHREPTLRLTRPELCCVLNLGPRLWRNWRAKSQRTDRRCRVTNPLPTRHRAFRRSSNRPVRCLDYRRFAGCDRHSISPRIHTGK